jgi:putative phosphoribosyl transferase
VRDEHDVVVLGLARGGVPVAFEVARILHCPLDVLVVRKIGVPWQPEVAMGAISEDGVVVVEHDTVKRSGVSAEDFERVLAEERAELERRTLLYREGHPLINLRHQSVVIVDDGLATGATALAACEVVRGRGARRVIVAAPVTSAFAARRIEKVADQFVTSVTVEGPFAVGQWYEEFGQVSDQQVIDDLTNARAAIADVMKT